MITEGKAILMIRQDKEDEKVSLRIITDYTPAYDTMLVRIDILTADLRQFNCEIELENSQALPKPHGIEGFSTVISKNVLISIFEGFLEKLKETKPNG